MQENGCPKGRGSATDGSVAATPPCTATPCKRQLEVQHSLQVFKELKRFRQAKRAQRLTFWVRRPPGGVGVFHAKRWWPKSSRPHSKVCLPWVSKRGIWDVPGILPGCPGPLGVFKKFVHKKFVRIFRSLKVGATGPSVRGRHGGVEKRGRRTTSRMTPIPKRGFGPPSYGTFSTPLRCQCSVFSCTKIHDRAEQKLCRGFLSKKFRESAFSGTLSAPHTFCTPPYHGPTLRGV